MNFPQMLDNARVLYFTSPASYGTIFYTTGEIAHHICYLAICKYENDNNTYYLFDCDADYEVVSDSPWSSIEECMCVAKDSYDREILWVSMT